LIGSILGFKKVSDISTRYKILVMIEAQDIVLRIYSWEVYASLLLRKIYGDFERMGSREGVRNKVP
jgi:hypothetical protein